MLRRFFRNLAAIPPWDAAIAALIGIAGGFIWPLANHVPQVVVAEGLYFIVLALLALKSGRNGSA